jgi:hypothetical protein
MRIEKHGRGVEQAWQMLDIFASLGVHAFDLTRTDMDGHKRGFRAAVSGAALRTGVPGWLAGWRRRSSASTISSYGPSAPRRSWFNWTTSTRLGWSLSGPLVS